MPAPQTEGLITVDGVEHARHVIEPGDYVIGRNPDCHIRVDVDLVSREHAKLILNYDNALIEDMGSSNGTFVNDQPVTERTRLWPSQKICIGAAIVTLRRKVSHNREGAPQMIPSVNTGCALARLIDSHGGAVCK